MVLELKLHEVPTTDSSQVHRVQVQVHRGVDNLDLCQTASPEERSKFYQDCLYPRLLVSQLVSVVLFNKEGET